jgi:hypothetical protein
MSENGPFIVFIIAGAILFMLHRVVEFLTNVAVRIGFSTFVPLLENVS